MTENPYAPPSGIDNQPPKIGRSRRPWGVSIVAVLLILPGTILFLGIALILAVEGWANFAQFFKGQTAGRLVFILGIIPFGILAGVGMLRGASWAWHAGQLYIFVNAYSLFRAWIVYGYSPEVGPSAVTAIYLLCSAYLVARRPREYFGLSCAAAIWSAVTGGILAIGIYHVLTWFPVPFM